MKRFPKQFLAILLTLLLILSVFPAVSADPVDTGETDYYLFGWIDGADYAAGDVLGEYKFVDGKLTATFLETSYVGVKTNDGKWYMTDGWAGEVDSVILYNTEDLGEDANKLQVPGGVELEFTLVVNDDDTLTLSYAEKGDDPGPEPGETAYYLFGWINGADYAMGDDPGEYRFINGKLAASFEEVSYVGVRTNDGKWYMTDGWAGEVTSVVLHNTEDLGEDANKLQVPGGSVVTFTLTVNEEDDTLTLSYKNGSDPDPSTLSPYYLTGGMNSWNTKDANYRLYNGENEGEFILESIVLEQGTEVKIVNPTTNEWYPGGANYKVKENGIFDLSFYPAGGQAGYYEGYFKFTKVGNYNPDPTDVVYYLTGSFADWSAKDEYKLVPGENEGEYVINEVTLSAGDGVKVTSSKNAWFPSGTGNEYIVPTNGVYNVSFYPVGAPADYYEGFFKLTRIGGYIPTDHTGADDKVILHCWNWSFDEIREYLPQIQAAGYTAIQTSPAQPHSGYQAGEIGTGDWWMLYQPLGLHIAKANESWLGDVNSLKALCTAAHELGIEVIVDVVSNHICNGYNDIAATGVDPYSDSEIIATGTNWEGKTVYGYRFETLPDSRVASYNPELFQEGLTRYFRDYLFVNDDATENTVHGNIGMPDFKTEEPVVQQSVLAYLKELIDAGVDGFRFDAAKHIETPNDGEFASDFWPVIIGGAEEYAESKGKSVWSYGEILSTAGHTRKMNDYAPYIDMTEISYAYTITEAFGDHLGASKIANQLFKDWLGVDVETLSNSSLVLMAESHDLYAQSSDSFSRYDTEVINKAWAVATARADTSSLYFARPLDYVYGLNADDPSLGYPVGTLGKCENVDWMNPEVAAVNKFHTAFVGGEEAVSASNDFVVVERWNETDSGVVIVNAGGSAASVYVTVSYLADGTYYDQITGAEFSVSAGKVSGQMGPTGIVVLQTSEPVICDHPADQRSEKVTEPTCTEPGWTYIYCDVCHQLLSKVESAPALGHIDEDGDNRCDRCHVFLGTITVYFVDTNKWIPKGDPFDCVRYHAWNDSGSSTAWPGKDMEIVGRSKDDFGIWKVELNPEQYTKIIFNAGDNGMYQTVDLSYVEDAGSSDFIIYTAEYDAPDPNGRTYDGEEMFYLNAAAVDWWANDGAILRVSMIDKNGDSTEFDLEQLEDEVWGGKVPAGTYVKLKLLRVDPTDNTTVWNNTSELIIPSEGNMIDYFQNGSAEATWTIYGSVQADKINAIPGGVLKDICGHTIYEIVSADNGAEYWVCDCCGETFKTTYTDEFRFDDVKDPGKFYFEPVYWAIAHDPVITTGTSDTLFSPNKDCTRGQVVTFLWRLAGEPEPSSTTCSFTDVKASAYYYKAMLWAVENGITSGTSATKFEPNKACTRGQVVTFLWRYAGEPEATSTEHPFTDVKEGAYYYSAMLWAVETGVTSGFSATTFAPNKACTRGQVVTFLYRAAMLDKD